MDLTGRTNDSSLPFESFTKREKGRSPNLVGEEKRGFSLSLCLFFFLRSKEIFFHHSKFITVSSTVERAREQRAWNLHKSHNVAGEVVAVSGAKDARYWLRTNVSYLEEGKRSFCPKVLLIGENAEEKDRGEEARLERWIWLESRFYPNLTNKLCSEIKHRRRGVEGTKRWSALAAANNTFARPKYIDDAFKRGSRPVFCPLRDNPFYIHRFNIHPNLCSNNPRWWIGHLELKHRKFCYPIGRIRFTCKKICNFRYREQSTGNTRFEALPNRDLARPKPNNPCGSWKTLRGNGDTAIIELIYRGNRCNCGVSRI